MITVNGSEYNIKPEMIEVKRYTKKIHGKCVPDKIAPASIEVLLNL